MVVFLLVQLFLKWNMYLQCDIFTMSQTDIETAITVLYKLIGLLSHEFKINLSMVVLINVCLNVETASWSQNLVATQISVMEYTSLSQLLTV